MKTERANLLPFMSKVQLIKNSTSGIMPAHMTRVLVFERPGGSFLIDQHIQAVQAGYIYLLSPLHSYHLDIEQTGNVMAIDVPYYDMTPDCKQALNYVALWPAKGFSLEEDTGYYQLLDDRHSIQSVYLFEEALLSPLSKSVKKAIETIPELNTFYLEIAERFIEVIATARSPLSMSVTDISVVLNTHKQTLQRACSHILNSSIKKMIDQFIISQVIYRMLAETKTGKFTALSAIAGDMNFSTESEFSRFFKNKTGMSPAAFRKKYI